MLLRRRKARIAQATPTSIAENCHLILNKKPSIELTDLADQLATNERETSRLESDSIGEVVESKYHDVWLRARIKLKGRYMIKRLMQEINLYGTTQDYVDELENYLSEAQIRRDMSFYTQMDEEEEPEKWWIIYPNSNFKSVWNVLLILLLLYTATLMPYRISFVDKDDKDGWWYWELLVDFGFFMDILVTCFSAFTNSESEVVTDLKAIVFQYIKTWMLIDIIAIFPFDLINEEQASGPSSNDYSTLIRLVRLPRLYRLMRITRVMKVFSGSNQSELVEKFHEAIRIKHSFMRLLKSFISVLVCLHIIACFWYFAAKINDFGPNTWVYRYGYLDSSQSTLYVACFYWALTTLATVGYGDITPGTNVERCLAMAWMVFGMVFFSFTIGSLTSMICSIDTKETVLNNKLAVVDEFAKQSHLNKSIRTSLRNALRYSTDKQGFSWADKISIFNELPRNLKYEVAMAMHKGAAKQLPFFADKDPMFICHVVPFLQTIMVVEGDYIFQEDEYADEIYFLIKGRAAFVAGNEKTPYKSLQANSYFGEIEIFKQIPRKYSAMALVDCELLSLSRQMVTFIREEFPSIAKEMIEIAEQRDKLNTQTKKALKHLQKLKRTGKIETMSQEEIRESVEAYAKQEGVVDPNPTTNSMEELRNFLTQVEQQLNDTKTAVSYLLDALSLPAPKNIQLSVPSTLL
mmetsp:Transcript_11318/g.22262  ORF Transcript_11318/g.22262 Transcript_11318/m.22262 type:complete len:691 (-) Transcript_11318:114-2186(-)